MPFLCLPPEIRNHVYHLVLGGHEIHILADEYIVRHQVCSHNVTLREEVESIVKAGTEIGQRTWQHHHHLSGVVAETRSLLSLGLLVVCRQIHAEAALIPFMANAFSFSSGVVLHHFARHLIKDQKQAITSIGFILGHPDDVGGTHYPTAFDLKKLSGAKHLTVVADIATPNTAPDIVKKNAQEYFDWIGKVQKEGGWESVVVAITAEAEVNRWGGRIASQGGFQAETRELERKLMKGSQMEAKSELEGDDAEDQMAVEEVDERQIARVKRGLRRLKTKDWAKILDEELEEE